MILLHSSIKAIKISYKELILKFFYGGRWKVLISANVHNIILAWKRNSLLIADNQQSVKTFPEIVDVLKN